MPSVLPVAFDDEVPFSVGQILPGNVQSYALAASGFLQLGELRAIVRLAPGFDRTLVYRERWVRHHQGHVELDDVAEAMTDRTRPERVVEGEESRLRGFILDVAGPALEPFGKHMDDRRVRHFNRKGSSPAFEIRGFD